MMKMTLGSLFSGSGGFELAGLLNGIEPRWDAEIEPFPCAVTAKRFPGIPNHGDVTKIDGSEIEPVDIISFGSPCQDLSVAGLRKGIHEGQRSNLFFEAIRIIKEMREATNGKYPRFAVWENVPGAFSSNGGSDFRAVLEALCQVKDPGISVPGSDGNPWKHAGCIVGAGYSIAWRVYDAQFWGVPQRRARIYLIADFGSERAGEILFEPESLPGNPAESREPREAATADSEGSTGRGNSAVYDARGNGGGADQSEPYRRSSEPGDGLHSGGRRERVWNAGNGQSDPRLIRDQAYTLNCMHDQQIVLKLLRHRDSRDA